MFGLCVHCSTEQLIRLDGKLSKHKFRGQDCAGSSTIPTTTTPELTDDFLSRVIACFPTSSLVFRIPKPARPAQAEALAFAINAIIDDPYEPDHWLRLFAFAKSCLRTDDPRQVATPPNLFLVQRLKARASAFMTASVSSLLGRNFSSGPSSALRKRRPNLGRLISKKINEADVRGAVRIATSLDKVAPHDDATLRKLMAKHPSAPSDPCFPQPISTEVDPIQDSEVVTGIHRFTTGSAGGFDGLRPQHLKDCISHSALNPGKRLLHLLGKFCTLVANGTMPDKIRPIFFGANVTALSKPDGGIRPIAVGCTLRRLVSRILTTRVRPQLAAYLSPHQLGFGVPGGCEAAIHAVRKYCLSPPPDGAILQLDFENAFNAARRDIALQCVIEQVPEMYNYIFSAYGKRSLLKYGTDYFWSEEGFHQGDPFASPLFSLVLHPLILRLSQDLLRVFFLDDGTLRPSIFLGGSFPPDQNRRA